MNVPEPGWTTAATVTRVIDGDTVEVEIRKTVQVRLLDCWAPESNTPEGKVATARLRELIEGQQVVLQIPASQRDEIRDVFTFSRVLGRIWAGGCEVADWLVQAGYAKKSK